MPIRFADPANPTDEEIRQWALADAVPPMEDFDVLVADLEHLPTLLELVGDPSCPARRYLLGSLYCLVGHSDLRDQRILDGVVMAEHADDSWLRTWAARTRQVLEHPETRDGDDWCGWHGFRTVPHTV